MDPDLIMIVGIIVFGLSIPSLISAFSESRPPRMAIILIVVGAGMIFYAIQNKPGDFKLEEIPNLFISVIGRYIG